jgi:5-methylcytosine-specific restriction endonuclease McrA
MLPTCSVEGCPRAVYANAVARGLCRDHYRDRDRSVKLNKSGRPVGSPCEIEGCENLGNRGQGLCAPHYKRAYREANKERLLSQEAARRAEAPEISRGALARHKERNPGYGREAVARSRARKLGAEVRDILRRETNRLRAMPCHYCGAPGPSTLDHIIPLSRGGRHAIGNLIPACMSCNKRKAGRTIMEWRLDRH